MLRAAPLDRALWLLACVLALSVLATARCLTPSPSGIGTHQQLGLPPCGFLSLLGIPCPACGLTTSFAHMARGQWLAALRAHALGPALFVVTCAAAPGALWALWRGRSVTEVLARVQATRLTLLCVLLALSVWLLRLAR